MERFKKSLKIAITEKVRGLRLDAGQVPLLIMGSGERKIESLGSFGQDELAELIRKLMPHVDAVDSDQAVQGELSIVNFGELKLIGILGRQTQLWIFIPPQGNQHFRDTWNQLTSPDPFEQNRSLTSTDPNGDFSLTAINQDDDDDESIYQSEHAVQSVDPSQSPPEGHDEEQGGRQIEPLSSDSDDGDLAISRGRKFESNDFDPNFVPPQANINIAEPMAEMPKFPHESEATPADALAKDADHDAVDLFKATMDFQDGGEDIQPEAEQEPAFDMSSSAEKSPNFDYSSKLIDDIPSASPSHAAYQQESWMQDSPHTPDLASPQHSYSPKNSEPMEIHFGSHIPGETIDHSQGGRPIDAILKVMIDSGASDLHLTLGRPICLRIDGEIQRIKGEGVSEQQMRALLLPIMPNKNQVEFAEANDTDFAYEVKGLARFRVNIFRDMNGVGAVLRLIPSAIPSADDLGLAEPIRKFCELSKGLVLVTGPTGSGKSTTLAAMIDLINQRRSEHILTVEDPIEFVHEQKKCLVNQREVHRHTASFSKALRAALREDPDIILIGEMRDLETVAIAIETAETGHLVFGTLHTSTAISTIDRLIDQFPADQQEQIRIMLAESLKGVVAQTLVKRKEGGRVAAHEILVVDRAVGSLIREGNTHMAQNHMQTQKAKGNILLNDSLVALVASGVVHWEDAYAKAIDKDDLIKTLQKRGLAGKPSQAS